MFGDPLAPNMGVDTVLTRLPRFSLRLMLALATQVFGDDEFEISRVVYMAEDAKDRGSGEGEGRK